MTIKNDCCIVCKEFHAGCEANDDADCRDKLFEIILFQHNAMKALAQKGGIQVKDLKKVE